ncbi:TIGR01777 family protein [Halomonas sp. SH5A2]|uniref:TIGR01777 family oxidoreductase n=1 Tax=Halomonas sp. SH5A2 TaxID=2749040 RepID=UPI00163DE850|nr:TIGR01777 family oxidoreductase [Halomonas sp. SH5A2]QNI01572.1 TIGR01777 family protein [Halomonas sp. SH5A2]
MRVLVTGGSGFVGQRLCPALIAQGYEVQVVSRTPHKVRERLPRECDIRDSAQAFIDSPPDALVNLAGESIAAKRWSDSQKTELIRSRVEMTEQLVSLCEQLGENGQPLPQVMVSGSAMGYYGDQGGKRVTEKTLPHDEFAHRLCAEWEAAAKPIEDMGVRLAVLRIGLVLGAGGGTLQKMLPPFKLGLGGRFGDGKQFMPWIHRDDLVEAIIFLLNDASLSGAFNGSAPHPVTNAEFTQTLARQLHRPAVLPVPACVLKAGLGEMSQLLLTGADMRPERLEEAGFTFSYPTLDKALEAILKPDQGA